MAFTTTARPCSIRALLHALWHSTARRTPAPPPRIWPMDEARIRELGREDGGQRIAIDVPDFLSPALAKAYREGLAEGFYDRQF